MADGKKPIRDELVDYVHPIPTFQQEAEEAATRLRRSLNMEKDDDDNQNSIDPMQRMYYKKVRSEIQMKAHLIALDSLKITENNVNKILEIIDKCVKYLRWKSGSPYDSEERESFMGFIKIVANDVRPEDHSADEEKNSLWRKIMNHILDGGFPVYVSELWTELEAHLAQHEVDCENSSIWDNMTKEVLTMVHEFEQIIGFMVTATPEVNAPDVWEKMSTLLFPYIVKCMESILAKDLIGDSDHAQSKLVIDLSSATFNFLNITQDHTESCRPVITDIFKRYLQSTTKSQWQHQEILKTLAMCFTIQELKGSPSAGITLRNEDVMIVIDELVKAMKTGTTTHRDLVSHDYDEMIVLRRFLLNKENRYKIIEYGDSQENGIIELALKGVESKDWRLQDPSLECLKIIAEDETLIERLRENETCTDVLKRVRSSPHMKIRQKAVDVLLKILIKKTGEVKVTRSRLERTGCGSWTEYDVKQKIGESGFEMKTSIDMTGCDGEWLIELLMMRRENSEAYYDAIKEQFEIEPRNSLPFNKTMSRIEKLMLSQDGEQPPPPFTSLN